MFNAIRKIVVAVVSTIAFVISCVIGYLAIGAVALVNTFILTPWRWVERLMGKPAAARTVWEWVPDVICVLVVSILFTNPAMWFVIALRVFFYALLFEAAYDWIRSNWFTINNTIGTDEVTVV